jgi:site-specific recombinase XerD
LISSCGFRTASELNAADVEGFLNELRQSGRGKQTSNHFLKAVKQFASWLVRSKVLSQNPVAHLHRLNVQTDRRHDRRPLHAEELARLIGAAGVGRTVESIPGPDRALMYMLAAWTGYRKGEIGSLTQASFDLDSDPPIVCVEAAFSKRRRRNSQILHPDLVWRLKSWLAKKSDLPTNAILFPVSGKVPSGVERKTEKMMKTDLAVARANWLQESKTDKERIDRERSDFLKYRDAQGRFADFHANRHSFITNLARAGVSPKIAQEWARHSDIRLTMGVYTHVDLAEKTAAVRQLPGLWECFGSAPESQTGNACHSLPFQGRREPEERSSEESSEDVVESPLAANCHGLSSIDISIPDKIRTCNLRLRRPTAQNANIITVNDFGSTLPALTVIGECADAGDCHSKARNDAYDDPALSHLASVWQELSPHVREAVMTLVEADVRGRPS